MIHFEFFPKIEYSNNSAVNLMVRAKVRDAILENTALFYKYTLSDDERPDIIASKYYGNSGYTWAIFYANGIVDPILDWHKSAYQFQAYLLDKYSTIENIYSDTVPHHYEYYDVFLDKTYIIDEATYYSYLGQYEPESQTLRDVRKVSYFDYENELNEARRNIVVINSDYVYRIQNEFSTIFK